MADEIAFNQEHGLMTQYDTPQAEAANRRVDNPSARAMDLQVTRKAGANDIITFGTGDNLNAVMSLINP